MQAIHLGVVILWVGAWLSCRRGRLTGGDVFEGGTVVEICSHHLHSAPTLPSQRLGRAVAPDLEALLLRCLEKDPADRPQSARDLLAEVSACRDAGAWSEAEAARWWAERRAGSRPDARSASGR